jgi:hypothetical protein
VDWSELEPDFLGSWDQGQHVAIFGPNGVGKSTVSFRIINARIDQRNAYACILANKKRDPKLSALISQGWQRIGTWPPSYEARVTHRVLFWPPYPGLSDPKKYVDRFMRALDGMMDEGNWVLGINEARYWTEQMGLRTQIDELWTGSRSNGMTVVAEAQGPSWINTAMREELQWGFFFKPTHREKAKDVADITGDRDLWPELLALKEHEFILMKVRTDEAYISKLPPPSRRSPNPANAPR